MSVKSFGDLSAGLARAALRYRGRGWLSQNRDSQGMHCSFPAFPLLQSARPELEKSSEGTK